MARGKSYRYGDQHLEDTTAPKTTCTVEGCNNPGEYKAPVSRDRPNDYQWLCREHIAEFNKKWDYFSGMSQAEIEHFQRDAITGHRPTWRNDMKMEYHPFRAHEAVDAFMRDLGMDGRTKPPAPLPRKQREALAEFDLEHPTTLHEIKTTYKKLVKQFHPDANKGDKQAEDRFKNITAAYHVLVECYGE